MKIKKMDVNEISTPASELQTSSESDLYVTTMNPLDIQMDDLVPETNNDGVDGMFVLYALGGSLICFLIYLFFYYRFRYYEEVFKQQEMEMRQLAEMQIRQLREMILRTGYSGPIYEGKNGSEDFNQTLSRSRKTLAVAKDSCGTQRTAKYRNVNKGKKQEKSRIHLSPIPYFLGFLENHGKYRLQDNRCVNTTMRDVAEGFGAVSQNAENTETLGRVESSMSETRLCSTSRVNNANRFFPEDFKDLSPDASHMQKRKSDNELKSDYNATPTKGDAKQSPPIPKEKRDGSQSPDMVRKRLTKPEDPPL